LANEEYEFGRATCYSGSVCNDQDRVKDRGIIQSKFLNGLRIEAKARFTRPAKPPEDHNEANLANAKRDWRARTAEITEKEQDLERTAGLKRSRAIADTVELPLTDLVLGHPGIYSNLLELQHTIMYFATL
jgi:hypothetical protein